MSNSSKTFSIKGSDMTDRTTQCLTLTLTSTLKPSLDLQTESEDQSKGYSLCSYSDGLTLILTKITIHTQSVTRTQGNWDPDPYVFIK